MAAVDDGDHQPLEKLAQLTQLVPDLGGKLAGGTQDERLWLAERKVNPLENGDAEGTGFTGAGRGLGDDIPPLQSGLDRLLLNLGHFSKAHRLNRPQNVVGEGKGAII